MKKSLMQIAIAASIALPVAANATLYQFNAAMSGGSEVPVDTGSTATGFSVLFYDDFGTAALDDDLLSITTWANGLGSPLRDPASGRAAHIHFPATTTQNAGAVVNLTVPASPLSGSYSTSGAPGSVSFFSAVSGPAPVGTNTANGATTSLRGALLGGLAYVNIHTTDFTGGEIRGQYNLVSTIPEPSSYALMGLGLALVVGWSASRRPKQVLMGER